MYAANKHENIPPKHNKVGCHQPSELHSKIVTMVWVGASYYVKLRRLRLSISFLLVAI